MFASHVGAKIPQYFCLSIREFEAQSFEERLDQVIIAPAGQRAGFALEIFSARAHLLLQSEKFIEGEPSARWLQHWIIIRKVQITDGLRPAWHPLDYRRR